MKTVFQFIRGVAIASCAWYGAQASAGYIEVTVDGRSGPWAWSETLNSSYQYGPATQDFLAPTVIDLASIGAGQGQDLFIVYKSGLTSAFGGPPSVDQAGYVGSPFKDDVPGSSGMPFPSFYTPNQWGVNQTFNGNPVPDPENFGVFLMALVAALTDGSGSVVDPFPIGYVIPVDDGLGGYGQGYVFGISFQLNALGATQLQLGFNDDIFADNTGALRVCVASSSADIDRCLAADTPLPTPATLGLLLIGAVGLRRMTRARAT